jgi:hypothetical protein
VGKHEFCWKFDFPDLPAEDRYSLNVYHPKFHIEIESNGALQKFLKNKLDDDKLDWADSNFKNYANG